MSEVVERMQRALTQAQMFAKDTPLEAEGRAELVVKQIEAALETAPRAERDELKRLLELARTRVTKYQAAYAQFTREAAERARLFQQHERERLLHVIPTKV